MTLQIKVKNAGNMPEDLLMMKGVERYPPRKDTDGELAPPAYALVTGNVRDVIALKLGEEITLYVPMDHFDDFKAVWFKGKH